MGAVEAIGAMRGELEAIRRELHAHPELGFEEARTAALVQEKLAAWGIEVHAGIATTGVVGVLRGRGGSSARAVGLRADMDCLPIEETSGVPWRSRRPGLMHACGHDGHTAMLLGAARYLAETRAFDGTVVLIFQPAEEGRGGGARMVAEGLFERFPVDAVYALHNWPLLPPGTIAVRPGPMMAAVDELEIVVHGTGGHAAMPHLAVDAVVAGAQIISALQTVASRSVSPVEAVVVSVCSVQTSQVGAFNVLPESVRLLGTVRSFRPETRELAHARVRAIAGQVAAALGARAEVTFRRGNPATVNTPREAELAARVGRRLFGADQVITEFAPAMTGEDFACLLEKRPGAYVWLGQGGGAHGCFLHNPGYDFNDEVLPLGAGYLAALAEESLAP